MLYVQETGSLSYLLVCTGQDIACTVGTLCCFNSKPRLFYWKVAQHLLQYIHATSDYHIEHSSTTATQPPSLFTTGSNAENGGNEDNIIILHTGKRKLFPIWEYGLERGWTFKIVNQLPKNRITFGNIKCCDYFLIQRAC